MNKNMSFSKLKNKIYFDKKKINAIPYITSYYKKDWGFCLSKNELRKINGKMFKVFIDSKFSRGRMDYGELLIKGKSKKEILFSTYICHPSMINNELSGPAICTAIAHYLSLFKKKELNFSYRIIFVPETIGSIAYIHKNYKNLKKNVLAGFVINCAGDNRSYSFVHTPDKNTLADDMMIASLKKKRNLIIYEFKDRSSDERQYCSANVELPICSFSRSKAGSKNFPEYHTNLDNFKVVTKSGLTGSLDIFKNIIFALEYIPYPKSKIKCEPFMTKRGMYPTLSRKGPLNVKIKNMLDILAYSNGKRSIFYICNVLELDLKNCIKSLQDLKKYKLI
jgi:aminopeptidase-like protein